MECVVDQSNPTWYDMKLALLKDWRLITPTYNNVRTNEADSGHASLQSADQ